MQTARTLGRAILIALLLAVAVEGMGGRVLRAAAAPCVRSVGGPWYTTCRIFPPSSSASSRVTIVPRTSSSSSASSAFTFLRSSLPARSEASLPAVSSAHSRVARRRGQCPDKALLGALFSSDQMTCGSPGWTFPGLIWGDCPITACILKTRPGVFGGPTDF